MYLLTQLWMFLAVALSLGAVGGFAVKRLLVQRRWQAIQHGAWVEQEAHRATMALLADDHQVALQNQAQALQTAMAEAEAARIQALEADHGRALDELQQRARRDLAALVRAHDDVQAEARSALQRAQAELALETAARAQHESELARLRIELDALRQRLADTVQRHEQVMAEVVEQSQAQARLQLEVQAQAYEQALATEREALTRVQHQQDDDAERLRQEAGQLREQLDAMLVELSAAARARDAREAQRAQLAQELAIETAARRREADIAQAQRTQLRERVVQLNHEGAARQAALQAECDALHQQLLVSRRTTQAAVLAARQREQRMEAALGQLREQLGEQAGGAPVQLVRVA
jgi:ParB family chromosome partitioning protein